jgi:hypothetical protein
MNDLERIWKKAVMVYGTYKAGILFLGSTEKNHEAV